MSHAFLVLDHWARDLTGCGTRPHYWRGIPAIVSAVIIMRGIIVRPGEELGSHGGRKIRR